MITIRGKQFSEETIVEALEKHCNFEEEKYIFQPGDVVVNRGGDFRIIVGNVFSNFASYNLQGYKQSNLQEDFEYWGYKKIGTLTNYIKEKK